MIQTQHDTEQQRFSTGLQCVKKKHVKMFLTTVVNTFELISEERVNICSITAHGRLGFFLWWAGIE
jgi:hypothetical protein